MTTSTLTSTQISALREEGNKLEASMAQLKTEYGPNHPEVIALQSKIDSNKAALQVAQAASPSPELARLIEELNDVASSFRNEFMTVTDAVEQLTSEDENERGEAYSTLQDGLAACTARTADLKNLVLSLRKFAGHA